VHKSKGAGASATCGARAPLASRAALLPSKCVTTAYICMYVCVCIHTHTHTHAHTKIPVTAPPTKWWHSCKPLQSPLTERAVAAADKRSAARK